ncbi:MAG TPA: hypothetical protein VFJ16_19335 [Longimicrobium sp.]|nr:hypothetical protein [Longimicrobium sp.]
MRVLTLHMADPGWAAVQTVSIGRAPAGGGTPELYLLVERDDGERIRVDLWTDRSAELYHRTEAVAWAGWVVIGLGYAVYLLDPGSRDVRTIRLPLYFDRFVEGDDWLLAVSGAGITRLNRRGEVDWENAGVAVDGVTIEDVRDGVITGDAEWDPPGGWRPFRVDLATGRSLPPGP